MKCYVSFFVFFFFLILVFPETPVGGAPGCYPRCRRFESYSGSFFISNFVKRASFILSVLKYGDLAKW